MLRELKIENSIINEASKPFVIAEIGHNHQGSIDLCKKIIEAAAKAGADAVKLQKRNNKAQFTKKAYANSYNSENSFGKTYGEHREFLEFDKDQYVELINFSKKLGLIFISTAFDIPSLEFLIDVKVSAIKIASGDIVNHPLLLEASKANLPLIISTGASTFEEIDMAYKLISPQIKNFAFLQCTSSYPAKYQELNIRVITNLQEKYPETIIGFSSHENGISAPIAAYALGARIFEKHFTTDRTMKGTDQIFSLSPIGLEKLCRDLERMYYALGDGEKVVFESEKNPMKKQRKSLVASKFLAKGTKIKSSDIAYKVPNEGLLPYQVDLVMGKELLIDLDQDEYFKLEYLKN